MKYYYLSSMNGMSGICKYSRDFYELVLKEKGYLFVDSTNSISTILSAIASRDHVHIELGLFQKKEIEVLMLMLKANYKNISITLHDAPLVKYPFREFKNPLLHKLSKAFDIYSGNSGPGKNLLEKIKTVYALSRKGQESIKRKYDIDHVHFLPHVIDVSEVQDKKVYTRDLMYFGFIGRNKGLEYSLQLHQYLLNEFPDTNFYVAGAAIGKEKAYYEYLKKKYQKNVHYLGYVPDQELKELFQKATFAVIPFKKYKFYYPFSGSILQSLQHGKIVMTNKVNTIPEIIQEGKNGFYLSHNLRQDAKVILDLFDDKNRLDSVRTEIANYLVQNHSPAAVKEYYKD